MNIIVNMQRSDAKTLAEFVAIVLEEKNLSGYQVAERSGGGIDQSTVNRIKNGNVKNPSAPILQALAKGLGETEESVFAFARGKNPNNKTVYNERFEIMALKFDQLPKEGKEQTEELLNYLDSIIDKRLEEAKSKH